MKEDTNTVIFERPNLEDLQRILASLEHRPLTDRVRIALTLVKELEERMRVAISRLEAADIREDPWGYL